jgi:chromosome segregation ATPase
MTSTSYYFALIAKSFGLERRNKRVLEASSEMSLLREAEYHLGLVLWEKIEPIEELSVEYWNLRKLMKGFTEMRKKMDELNEQLTELQLQRAEILNSENPEQLEVEMQRSQLMLYMEKLTNERDMVLRRAKELRRVHEGLLTKIEVIKRDKYPEEKIIEVEQSIDDLKKEFRELKLRRQELAEALDQGDRDIDENEKKLAAFKQVKRDEAALIFQELGLINRELSQLRSEVGSVESEIRQLQSEVGRYISRYTKRNPVCDKVAKPERAMVEVMRMLRISISMNRKLADFK